MAESGARSAVLAGASRVAAAADAAAGSLQADLDNDGFADLAVGVLSADVGSIEDAGAVNVLYGGVAGADWIWQPVLHPEHVRGGQHRRGVRRVRLRARRLRP